MIAFYFDENAHGDILKGLRQRGVDVLRVQDDDYNGRPDPEVLDRSTALSRVLFSHDEDMLREATLRQRTGVMFSGLVFAKQMDISIGQCVLDLEYLAKAGEPEDFVDQVYYLPL